MAGDLPIHELGPKGDGIHKSDRGVIYVDRTLPGDSVQAKIRRGDDGIIRGDVVEVVEPSEFRVPAPCIHYEVCGGCTLQHAARDYYRAWKQEIVRDALAKKGLKPREWKTPVFLGGGNRRRATFAAYKKSNAVTMGYYKRRTHQVTDITECLVADPAIMTLKTKLQNLLVPILQEGKSADIFIQKIGNGFDMAMTGEIGKTGKPDNNVRDACAAIFRNTTVHRISWRARDRDEFRTLNTREPLTTQFGKMRVTLPPMAFLQPTKEGETALVNAVMELMPASGRFADLFSGCGTFTGPMLERGPVDAYEGVGDAIDALNKAARAPLKDGALLPLRAMHRDLFKSPLRRDDANKYDAIVFDPPRAGAKEQVATLASSKVPLLIGVSCNPATFARDARILVDGGYRLNSVRVIDQFTWSHHVELVAAFTKTF